MTVSHTFGAFWRPDSEYLILGSFPSVKSREMNFYYGHPQNRFWKILAAVFHDTVPSAADTDEKKAFLIDRSLADPRGQPGRKPDLCKRRHGL